MTTKELLTPPKRPTLGRPKRLPPADFDKTASAKDLAEKHGVSLPTVYKWLSDTGATLRTGPDPTPRPPDFDPAVTIREATGRWGVCSHTIRRWRKEATAHPQPT